MQFHPFAYIVKLNIEMSMADLIAKVSKCQSNSSGNSYPAEMPAILSNDSGKSWPESSHLHNSVSSIPRRRTSVTSHWASTSSSEMELDGISKKPGAGEMMVNMTQEVHVEVERRNSGVMGPKEQTDRGHRRARSTEEDTKPLKAEDQESEARHLERAKRVGVEEGMGVYTKVWAMEEM